MLLQKYLKCSLLWCLSLLLTAVMANAQLLKTFTLQMKCDSNIYLSLKNKTAYTATAAEAVRSALDLALVRTVDDNKTTLEWYNLKKDNEKVPEGLTGTQTGIIGMSFDWDQFEKCKTATDLDRMTGHITVNSYSHFAVISPEGHVRYPCFLARVENGKKALVFVTAKGKDRYGVSVKMQE